MNKEVIQLQSQVANLKNLIEEIVLPELKNPIAIEWNGDYGNQRCVYCRESLGNMFSKRDEHLKICEHIPANKIKKLLKGQKQ